MHSRTPKTQVSTSVATLITDEPSAQNIADLIVERFAADEAAVALVDTGQGRWCVSIYFCAAPDKKAVRALIKTAVGPEAGRELCFERVAAKDWVGASLAGLRPVTAGRFVVHGAHDRGRIAPNRIGIEIEAALAFGSGHHGTTRGCLLALDGLCKSLSSGRAARRILDIGTGSGVLAIAAARALRQRVLATDIDPSAVRVARANAKLNGVGPMVELVKADGPANQTLRARAPFDLIFANILLGPLQRLASPLVKITAPGGRVVISGLLTSQANAAITAYRALTLQRRIELDGWTTLVFKRQVFRRHLRRRSAVARDRSGP
jgi:ribosomal protein L11 methyltransferase